MQVEIEAKFLRQDHNEIRKKLHALGARCEHPMQKMRRRVFDYPNRRLQAEGAWVRLREELDGSIELTLKQVKAATLTGTHESTVGVADYDAATALLVSLGLEIKGEQESKRELWRYKNVEVMLDEWPWVPPFIEIEAPTEAEVQYVAGKLGLPWKDAIFGGVTPVYTDEYGITAGEFESLELSMMFGAPIPEQLSAAKSQKLDK